MEKSKPNVPVQSVERSIQILQAVKRHEQASVSTLASEVDAAKSTVHNHLLTLQRHGLVTQDNDSQFRLGHKILEYSSHFKRRYELTEELAPAIRDLAYNTGKHCTLLVENNEEGTVVLMFNGEDAPSVQIRERTTGPLHAIPGGKVILAYHSPLRDTYLNQRNLAQLTERTLDNPRKLNDELEQIVEQGYAMNEQEYTSDLRAISIPVIPRDDRKMAAISIIDTTEWLKDPQNAQDILNQLFAVQDRLSVYKSSSVDDFQNNRDERTSFWTQYGTSS